VFLYSLRFLLNDLPDMLNDFVSILIYMGYSILLAITLMFATCSIGLLPSFLLVHHIFTAKVKFLETSTEPTAYSSPSSIVYSIHPVCPSKLINPLSFSCVQVSTLSHYNNRGLFCDPHIIANNKERSF